MTLQAYTVYTHVEVNVDLYSPYVVANTALMRYCAFRTLALIYV